MMRHKYKALSSVWAILMVYSMISMGNIGPFPGGSSGGGGSGSVTSVGLADGSSTPIYGITGSPVTTSGTLTFSLGTQGANKVFSGPTSGGAAQPTFRSLVSADLPAGIPSGSGTINLIPVWTTTGSVLGNSSWQQGTIGEFQWTKFSTQPGTAASPLVNLEATGTSGIGMYTNTTGDLLTSVGGLAATRIDGNNTLYLYKSGSSSIAATFSGSTANEVSLRPLGGSTGTLNNLHFKSQDTGAAEIRFTMGTALADWYLIDQTSPSDPNFRNEGVIENPLVIINAWDSYGYGIGPKTDRLNALTVNQQPDKSNIGGTTTANATGSIVGSSTQFINDFGIYDRVSLSSAASTYCYITTITDNTNMTVDDGHGGACTLGNGTSQTLNRKQAIFAAENSSRKEFFIIDDIGRIWLDAQTNGLTGRATCNATTEVTVNNTKVTTSTNIFLTYQSGAPTGVSYVSSRVAGTSFGFKCGAADTTSVISYLLVEPI